MKGTKAKDLGKLSESELKKKLEEMENALLLEKKSTRTRPLRKAIARIKTILHQITKKDNVQKIKKESKEEKTNEVK